MSKIFKLLLLLFLFLFNISLSFAENKVRIYSRSEWWADEKMRYVYSPYWKKILDNRKKRNLFWQKKFTNFSQKIKESILKKNNLLKEKKQKSNNYLLQNFKSDVTLVEYNIYDWTNKLAWPTWKTEFIKNIVIHHTYSEFKNSWTWVKNIYKYHTLNKEWWDIWYNYIIWYDWEIFEGRAWGDYVVAAHDTWNNRSTVWISIMWNYENKNINSSQYKSLKNLIWYLAKKYWIDFNKKIPYHRACSWANCISGLETNYYYPIVWHRDWKSTVCPWKFIYSNTIPNLLNDLKDETYWYEKVSYLEIQKNKIEYKNEINKKYNWEKINQKFLQLSESKRNYILIKLERFTKYHYYDWKKEILYKKVYDELKS